MTTHEFRESAERQVKAQQAEQAARILDACENLRSVSIVRGLTGGWSATARIAGEPLSEPVFGASLRDVLAQLAQIVQYSEDK